MSSLASRYRARHVRRPAPGELVIDGSLFADLRREASRRGTDVNVLASRLLYCVLSDKLVDAILDEGA